MATKTTIKRTKEGVQRSQARTIEVDQQQSDVVTKGPKWAVWILSRFPGVRYRYQKWGKTKRIAVAILLYFVALPIIPIIVAAVWYAKDPEGFKKSPLMPVLVAVIAAWLGGFGYIANQTPVTDGSPYASVKPQADGESNADNNNPAASASKASKDKIANQQTSKSTNGRHFENCTAAFDEGVFDIKRNNPSYERRLDRDNDGIACEK
ncbi:excalibur calcium-binding domain-containing protein [Microbacteriaceae bacterium]|nr:excalibur calcium-binding domain-containing protein [Candidatus Saccharibacteria bacterium]